MNEIDVLRKLNQAARAERPPVLDVSGQVLRNLRLRRRRDPMSVVFGAFAGASVAAACAVCALAVHFWVAWNDPLQEIARVVAVTQ